MISVRNRGRIIMAFTLLLIGLMVLGMAYTIMPREDKQAAHAVPTPMSTPGLLVYGTVQGSNGDGLAGVEISRSYAAYPGVVIATTGADGYYESDFAYIPGDEMVTVWVEGSGLVSEPPNYTWRHYYGYEQSELNFVIETSWESYLPVILGKPGK